MATYAAHNLGADRDVYIARVMTNDGDTMPRCVEDLAAYTDAVIVVAYADRHGERVINRRPLTIDGNIITDAKGRQWRARGVAYGDPRNPSFMPWGDGVAKCLGVIDMEPSK